MRLITSFLLSAFLTMTIELIVLFLLGVKDKRLWYSLIINFITNIILNSYLYLIKTIWLYYLLAIIGEVLVFLIEWFLYQIIIEDKKNWFYSLIANSSSLLFGSLIFHFIFATI